MLTDFLIAMLVVLPVVVIDDILAKRSYDRRGFAWKCERFRLVPLFGYFAWLIDRLNRHEITRITEMDAAIRKAQEK